MQLKIFTGNPETLETALAEWLQEHRHRISHVLQSQSTDNNGQVLLAITLFYEQANVGTGLGFRLGS